MAKISGKTSLHLDQLDHKEFKEIRVSKGPPDHRVPLAMRDLRVSKVFRV